MRFKNRKHTTFWMSLKDGIPGRNLRKFRRIFFFKLQKFRHGIFNQNTKKVHLIENFILYTMLYVNLQNSVFWFHDNSNFVNLCIASYRE
jgi:hypothetical protein